MPTTVSFSAVPFATVGLDGFIAIETSLTLETVSVVDRVTEPQSASIVVAPVATLLVSPVAVMVATDGLDDFHRTCCVMSSVELSLNVPVAVNCLLAPTGMLEFNGAMARETRVAGVTVTEDVPLIEPDMAVTVDVPAATATPNPLALMVRTL